MLWRNLAAPANPGKNPKNVGAIETPNCSRLPWRTNFPPVRAFRTAKCWPASGLVMPTLGVNFQGKRKKIGRLIDVSQSSEVEKLPFRNWVTLIESFGSGVSRLGTLKVSLRRP